MTDQIGREIERNQTGWGCSSVGRAVALQAIGQEFDSPQLHHCYPQGALVDAFIADDFDKVGLVAQLVRARA